MTTWTDDDLGALRRRARKCAIAGMRRDGSLQITGDRVGSARRRRPLHPIGERTDAAWFRGVADPPSRPVSARATPRRTSTSSTEARQPTTT